MTFNDLIFSCVGDMIETRQATAGVGGGLLRGRRYIIVVLRLRGALYRSPIRRLGGVLQFLLCIFRLGRIALDGLFCAGIVSAVSLASVGIGIRCFRVDSHIVFRLLDIPGFRGRRSAAVRVHHHIALLGAAGRERGVGDLIFAEAAHDHNNQHSADGEATGHRQPFLRIVLHCLDSSFFCWPRFWRKRSAHDSRRLRRVRL